MIAIQDVAYRFVSEYRNGLFGETAIIFLVQSRPAKRLRNSTGLIAEPDLAPTVALAMALQPDTRQVFVITGASVRDKYYEAVARTQLRVFGRRITLTYLSGLLTADLERRLAALPEHSIVYYELVYQDGDGENFNPLEYLNRIASRRRRIVPPTAGRNRPWTVELSGEALEVKESKSKYWRVWLSEY